MILQSIRIDRFGGCSDLQLDGLEEGVQVLQGAVGAGKRTVLQFVRAMLFGFDRQIRSHYLPVDSRGFGGAITLSTKHGIQTVSRYDDGGVDGRLTVEHQDGSVIGHRQLEELLGGMTTERFDHLFAVDFATHPHVECLVANAKAAGISLTAEADSIQISELRHQLDQCQREFRSLPQTTPTLESLQRQQRAVAEEIASVETLIASGATEPERGRLIEERDRITLRLSESRGRLDQLDEAIRQAMSRKQPQHQPGAAAADVHELDRQVVRWRGMIKEIESRKRILQSEVSQHDPVITESANPRRPLAEVEQQVRQLQTKLTSIGVDRERYSLHDLKAEMQSALTNVLEDLYALCSELGRWESNHQARRHSSELDQLARCEAELQHVVETLLEKRRVLVGQDTAYRPDQWCECADHPRPHASASQRSVAELDPTATDVEIADLERSHQRTRDAIHVAERELVDLNRRIAAGGVEGDHQLHARLQAKHEDRQQIADCIRSIARRQELAEDIAQLQFEIKGLERLSLNSPVHAEASRYVRTLSGGALQQLEIDAGERVYAYDQAGRRFAWEQLDEGGRDQTYLSVLLAVHSMLARRGCDLPLILREAFSHLDAADAPAAAALLCDFARHRQLIVLTSHQHVADVFTDFHVPIHQLAAQSPGLGDARFANRWAAADERAEAASQNRHHVARYRLSEANSINDAPSLSHSDAAHFRRIGVTNVGQLLDISPYDAAAELEQAEISESQIRDWQAQAMLMCRVPDLRAYDARILVACDVTDPDELRSISPSRLREIVQEFANSSNGKHLLLSGTEYELSRLTDWMDTEQVGQPADGPERSAGRSSRRGSTGDSRKRNRRKRSKGSSNGKSRGVLKMREKPELRFFLNGADPVVEAPSIGPRTAERLAAIGIDTVHHLVVADAEDVAERLGQKRINENTVREWQQQTTLAIRVPQLRGHDAQILVALEISTPEQLAEADPDELWADVKPFIRSNRGKRIIRNGRKPDLQEVTDWIGWASQARSLKAA